MINYPMRTLGFPEGWGPETLGSSDGAGQAGRRTGRNGRRRARGHRPSCTFPGSRLKRPSRPEGILRHRNPPKP